MSSTGFNKLPETLVFDISKNLDHASIARLSCVCKNLSRLLKVSSQKAARKYAFLPSMRAPRCGETEDLDIVTCTRPAPSASHIEMAIIEDRVDCLRAFLDAGVNPNSFGTDRHRLLATALRNRRLDAVNMLIEYKVDLNLYLRLDLSSDGYMGCHKLSSPMAYASWYRRCEDVDSRCFAIDTGGPNRSADVISLLIRAGYKWFTVVDLQAMCGRPEFPHLMKLAFDYGLDLKKLRGKGSSKDKLREAFSHIIRWPSIMNMHKQTGDCSNFALDKWPIVHEPDTQDHPEAEYLDLLAVVYAKYPEFLEEQLFILSIPMTALQEAILNKRWMQVAALLNSGSQVGVPFDDKVDELEFLGWLPFFEDRYLSRRLEELRIESILEMRLQLIWYNI